MVGLGNVTNESKATMFTSPTFTGTVTGVSKAMVGLGSVTNESKATMFSSPTFTGTVTAPTVTIDASTNVATNAAVKAVTDLKAPLAGPTFTGAAAFTGTVFAPTVAISDNSTKVATTAFVTSAIAAIPAPGVSASMVGLGSVTNESKATMFTNPTFTGTNIYLNASNINIPSYGSLYVYYGGNINVGSRLYDNNSSINTHNSQISDLFGRMNTSSSDINSLRARLDNLEWYARNTKLWNW
jgi:hypothetical protein